MCQGKRSHFPPQRLHNPPRSHVCKRYLWPTQHRPDGDCADHPVGCTSASSQQQRESHQSTFRLMAKDLHPIKGQIVGPFQNVNLSVVVVYLYKRFLNVSTRRLTHQQLLGSEFENINDEEKAMMPLFMYPYTSFLVSLRTPASLHASHHHLRSQRF